MFIIYLLILCVKSDLLLTSELVEGQDFVIQGWLDNSENILTSKLICDESLVGPYFGEINTNIYKRYTNIKPHYEALISIDVLFRGYWIQQNNYINILIDGSQVKSIKNIQSKSFLLPNDYCYNNLVNFQTQKQNLTTITIQINHQQSDLQIDIQGSFWCSTTDPLACEKIAIKNLVIVTKECHQSCLTCYGPNINNCLSCPFGSLIQGTCQCTIGFAYEFECISSCPQFYQNQNGQCILECSLNCLTCSNNKCSQCLNNYYNVKGICYQNCPSHAIMQGQKCLDYSELSQYGSNYIEQFFSNGIIDLYQVQQFFYVEKHANSGQGQGQNYNFKQIQDYYSIYNNKIFLGGFGIWTMVEYQFKYSQIPQHNNIVIYVTAYFIDNWNDDLFKIYVDGNEAFATQIKSLDQTSNLMLRNSKDKIQKIYLSVKHTSSTLSLAFSPKVSSNNYEASFAISDLYILADNCDNNCIKCGSTSCLTCQNGYKLVNKICTYQCDSNNANCNNCQTGYYFNTSTLRCQPCQDKCSKCSSDTSCEQCNSGYYNLNNICTQCSQNCSECSQTSTCTKCLVGYVFDQNNMCSSCNFNQLVINNQCQDCSYKCSSCSVSQYNCLQCDINRSNPPLCNCNDGYYEESNICNKCQEQCQTCANKTDCLICVANRINSPLCSCPPNSFDNLSIGNAYCSTCELGIGVASFSEDLQEIIIDFGQPISNLQITCEQILILELLDKIGQKKVCFIRNASIIIQLNGLSTIQPGEYIQIIPYQLKFTNCPNLLQNIIDLPILMPNKLIIPEVIFNTTFIQYSNCQDSIIQISKTINNGGRPLQFIQWTVLDDQNLNHFFILEDYLNQHIHDNRIMIPKNIIFPSDSYTLTLIFMNFLQQQGQQVIKLQNNKNPIIISTYFNQSTYYNYQKINIINDPYLVYCQNNIKIINKNINLKIIAQNSSNINYLEQNNQSTINQDLGPYYFTLSGIYNIIFDITIFYQQESKALSINQVFICQLYIIEKDWVFQIKNQNRIIGFNQELLVDLEIINPNKLNQQIDLDINWMCVQPLISKECKDSNGNLISFNNSHIQTFKEKTFEPFQVIIMIAQSIIGGKVYQSQITIQIIETNLPQFKILLNNQLQFQKINYYDEIYIELQYPIQKDPDDLYFSMQIGDENFTTQSYRFYDYKLKFRVREKIQLMNYQTLNLKFSIYNPDYYTASTNQVQIYLNDPPKQCIITSNQTENITILNNILITVSNCVDDEYPLKFMFVFYDNKDDFIQDQYQSQIVRGVILQNFSLSNQIFIRLYDAEFNLIQVFVKDSYHGFSNFTMQFNNSFSNATITQNQLFQTINYYPNNKVQLFIDLMAILGYINSFEKPIPQEILQFITVNNTNNQFKFDEQVNDMYFEIHNRLIQTQGFINSRDQINFYLEFISVQLQNIDQDIPNIFNYSVNLTYNSKTELYKLKLVDRICKYAHFVDLLFQQNFLNLQLEDDQIVDQNYINQKIMSIIDQLLKTITHIQFINEDTFIIRTKMLQLQVNKLSRQRVINKFGQIIDYQTSIDRKLMYTNQLEYTYTLAVYQNNPYQNMSEFSNNFAQGAQTLLYKPNLTLWGQPINQTLPVPFSFKNISQENSICVQRFNNIWEAKSCKTKFILDETICVCEQISPTTIINAFINVQGQIFRIFSYDSIQNIQNYPLYKVGFVYILLFYTLTYIWLMYKSSLLDLMETNPQDFNQKVHPTENIDDKQEIIHNQVKTNEIENGTQISQSPPKTSIKCIKQKRIQINLKQQQSNLTQYVIHQNSFHLTQRRTGSQQSQFSKQQKICIEDKIQNQHEENFDILSPQEYLHSAEAMNSPKLVIKTSTDGISIQNYKQEILKEEINSLNSSIGNKDINSFKGFLQYFKNFHVFFGIYFRYCEDQNRVLRSTLVYMSLLGQICILLVFGNQLNLSTILVLSFIQNVFGFIYKKLMSFFLNTNNLFIKYVGFNLTLIQCGVFYFIILASSCNYDSTFVANLWAASYICSFLLDYFVYSSIIMAIVFIINLKIQKYNNLQKLSQIILDKPQYAFFFG